MRAVFLFLFAMALILSGCGGGGGGNGGSGGTLPTTVTGATFKIDWPARSRDDLSHGLSSARSVTVNLVDAAADRADIQIKIDRDPAQTGAHTSTHIVPQPVRRDMDALTATFYADPGSTGTVVGTATAAVRVSGTSLNLASIVVNGVVKTVNVIAPDPLTVGDDPQQLLAATLDAGGATVAVTPGSVRWAIAGGGGILTLTPDGLATPVAAGSATVTANVDGITSAPVTITVRPSPLDGAHFRISWPARTRASLGHKLSSALSARVVLKDATPDGADITVVANRDPDATAAYTETYDVGAPVTPNVTTLTATFFAGADASGETVGTATASIEPLGNTLELASIVVAGRIRSVAVATPGEIRQGSEAVQLLAEAKDEAGLTVAVTPGSFSWKVTSGSETLRVTPDGLATGLRGGTAIVRATVDGVVSPPKTLDVVSNPINEAFFTIEWPSRTRAGIAHSLSSALSAKVKFLDAGANGADITVIANRDATRIESYTETYQVGQPVEAVSTLTATFHAGADGTGAVVGTATADIAPDENNLEVANLVVDARIKTVAVVDPEPIEVGETVQLLAEAKDADGDTVVVSTGSFRWQVTSGAARLQVTPFGEAKGLAEGDAVVRVTVDGVSSASRTIPVFGDGPSLQTVQLVVADMAYDRVNKKIWATVGLGTALNGNSVVSIDPVTGAIGDRVAVGGTPGLIAVTDNGQYAYVTVASNNTVRRVNLAAKTMGPSVNVGFNDFEDLATVPGKPEMFAVARDPGPGENLHVWNGSTKLDGIGAVGYRIHFASDGKTIYGDGHDSLFENELTETAVDWTDQDSLDVTGFQYSQGLIYSASGLIVDPATKQVVGQLPTDTIFGNDKHAAISDADDRVYIITWTDGIGKQLQIFDKSSRTALPTFDTQYIPGGARHLIACDNHTVAFAIYGASENVVNIVRNLP